MIRNGNRFQLQHENGETDVLAMIAIAIAAFDTSPRGLDIDGKYVEGRRLSAEDVADLDLIQFTPSGIELIMVGEIFGRDCSVHVTKVSCVKNAYEINRDVYEGWVDDLLLRAQDVLDELLPLNRRSDGQKSASVLQ